MHYLLYTIVFLLFVILSVIGILCLMYMQGGVYRQNKSSNCFLKVQDPLNASSFCDIKTIQLNVPAVLNTSVLKLVSEKAVGKRVEIPNWKAGRTISTQILQQRLPAVLEYYHSLPSYISSIIGETVMTTPLHLPTSCAVLIYEKKGDFINWHYDVNYFKGRFFTLLIPISSDNTCTSFMYKNKNGQSHEVKLAPGKALLFEGERVFHMASKLCDQQTRIILSMQFATDAGIKHVSKFLMRLKDVAYIG